MTEPCVSSIDYNLAVIAVIAAIVAIGAISYAIQVGRDALLDRDLIRDATLARELVRAAGSRAAAIDVIFDTQIKRAMRKADQLGLIPEDVQ